MSTDHYQNWTLNTVRECSTKPQEHLAENLSICNWEFKNYFLSAELSVYSWKGLKLVLCVITGLRVQENLPEIGKMTSTIWYNRIKAKSIANALRIFGYLEYLRTIKAVSAALANNFGWLHNVFKNALMHSGKGAVSGPLGGGTLLWRPHNSSGSNEDNILEKCCQKQSTTNRL